MQDHLAKPESNAGQLPAYNTDDTAVTYVTKTWTGLYEHCLNAQRQCQSLLPLAAADNCPSELVQGTRVLRQQPCR